MATDRQRTFDAPTRRIGLIVPSSNTTMETELPELFRRQQEASAERFSFHSGRVPMRHVNQDQLAAMVAQSGQAAATLADAQVEVIAYACLVAVMVQGAGAHERIEQELVAHADANGGRAPVVSSAGALIEGLEILGARRIVVIAPYVRSLTGMVCEYIQDSGIEVARSVSLEVDDNLAVGRLDTAQLQRLAREADTRDVDALVLSACVQMPSLAVVQTVEDAVGIPVLTAATATAAAVLRRLGLPARVSEAGMLLAGSSPPR